MGAAAGPAGEHVPPAAASFEAERKILSLLLRADVAATIDDGVGESGQTPSTGGANHAASSIRSFTGPKTKSSATPFVLVV